MDEDYGKGPVTVTMTIDTRNAMCKSNKELFGKLASNGHRMWCVETGDKHYFCIAQPHIEYSDVCTYVGGVAKQREINRKLLASHGPSVKTNRPEHAVPAARKPAAAVKPKAVIAAAATANSVKAEAVTEQEYLDEETY